MWKTSASWIFKRISTTVARCGSLASLCPLWTCIWSIKFDLYPVAVRDKMFRCYRLCSTVMDATRFAHLAFIWCHLSVRWFIHEPQSQIHCWCHRCLIGQVGSCSTVFSSSGRPTQLLSQLKQPASWSGRWELAKQWGVPQVNPLK